MLMAATYVLALSMEMAKCDIGLIYKNILHHLHFTGRFPG